MVSKSGIVDIVLGVNSSRCRLGYKLRLLKVGTSVTAFLFVKYNVML